MKTLSKIFLNIIVLLLLSCNENSEIESSNLNFRHAFIKGKSNFQIRQDFNNLPPAEKIKIWEDKLNQILKQNLPNELKTTINDLKTELVINGMNAENQISNYALILAEMIPTKDFEKMFFDLGDYNYNSFSILKEDKSELINFLKNSSFYYSNNFYQRTPTLEESYPPCNCNWSCGVQSSMNPAISYTDKCTPTLTGCGFMGMSGCYRRLYFV